MAEPTFSPFMGQRVRALRPGAGLVLVHDDTHLGTSRVQLPPVEMASFYERAQSGDLAKTLPEALPAAFSICWPERTWALVSRTRYLGGTLGAEANLVTHEIALRRSFFGRGCEALAALAGGPQSPFVDEWDAGRVWNERKRLERNAQITADPDAALGQLAEIACDPTVSTFPDERLAACMRAVVNLAVTGEPVVIEFGDREFLLRGAFGLDLPLSILLLAAALVPPARAPMLSLRSWGWARTPELAPGTPSFSCIAVPESTGAPKRVLPGARLIRADGSTDRPFPDDGTGKLVTAAVAAIRAARIGSPEEAPERLRVLRVLAVHSIDENPGLAAVWRAGRRAVPMPAIAAGVRCAAEAREPGEAVRLLADRGFAPLADPLVRGTLAPLVAAIAADASAGRYLDALLAGLQQCGRYDLLGQLCQAAREHAQIEAPVLRWLCGQDDLSRLLDLVAGSEAAEALRGAGCGAVPHGYRALASLLRLPGKPSPRLRALWSPEPGEGLGDVAGEARELLVALALLGRAPRRLGAPEPSDADAAERAAWLRGRMDDLLVHDAKAARKERRPRGATAVLLAAQIDAAGSCDGCAALLKAAISHGGRDLDAWALFLDRFAPEPAAWWGRALATWQGALAADLRAALPEAAERHGAPALDVATLATQDPAAAQIVSTIGGIHGLQGGAGHEPARATSPLPPRAAQHAVALACIQK